MVRVDDGGRCVRLCVEMMDVMVGMECGVVRGWIVMGIFVGGGGGGEDGGDRVGGYLWWRRDGWMDEEGGGWDMAV